MPETHAHRRFLIGGHAIEAQPLEPGLYLIATPIGNLADVTLRALNALAAADLVYCEDTRVTSRLLQRYGIGATLKPYHDHNAARVRPAILEALDRGQSVALASDAGTPLVSDPGYKLVEAALAAGHRIHMAPGPSAPVMALALSGLPTDRFLYLGFLPPKSRARRGLLSSVASLEATLVCFETAPRIEDALQDIAEVLHDPPVAVARELTKLHEEVLRGRASEVHAAIAERGGVKGEITVVIGPRSVAPDEAEIEDALAEALRDMPPAKAAAELARRYKRPRQEIYRRAMALKGGSDGGA